MHFFVLFKNMVESLIILEFVIRVVYQIKFKYIVRRKALMTWIFKWKKEQWIFQKNLIIRDNLSISKDDNMRMN